MASYARLAERTIERSELEPLTAQMAELSESIKATEFLAALDYLRRMGREVESFWRERDVLHGSQVRWSDGEGRAAGLNDSGALLVDTDAGQIALDAGEVHLLR